MADRLRAKNPLESSSDSEADPLETGEPCMERGRCRHHTVHESSAQLPIYGSPPPTTQAGAQHR